MEYGRVEVSFLHMICCVGNAEFMRPLALRQLNDAVHLACNDVKI
jgi:hypothetical protein